MLTALIVLLTALLVLDCAFLILLVLVQLPKKEAGAGVAFGAGTTDALFGAGSGTALTKITKYAATAFFAITLILAVATGYQKKGGGVSAVEEQLQEKASKTLPSTGVPLQTPSATTAPAPATSTEKKAEIPLAAPQTAPNVPATAPASNTPAPK